MPRPEARSWTTRVTPRLVVLTTVLALLGSLLGAGPAYAAGTLGVATTAYNGATPALGSPVVYLARTNITGGNVTSNIVVTQTMPAAVRPLAAYAAGFTCAAPSGQTITCTTTGTSFADGSSSPDITFIGIVTGSITAAAIRSTSSTAVRATGSTSGSDTAMATGTLPAAPSGISAAPTSGPLSGANTVTLTGTNIAAARAVEVGTTAELQAGTPVTLLACATGDTSSCFTVSGSNLLVYMPPRATAGPVSLTVVTLGVSGATNYTYRDRPSAPATPTATAGVTSATVSWSAPAANGSPITGYVVTPIRAGVAETPISYDTSTTTRTLTGLTAGSSYTFTVAAVNAVGTSTPSSPSAAVVPYALSAAPSTPTATASTLSATLTWTAPNNSGSAITGYRVTPYINGVAQTVQTFNSSATTQQVTGLTAGTAYTFTVAAINAAGTGPASAQSTAVTPNAVPTLTFAAPPAGRVGVAYSHQLTVNAGTAPFTWSVATGTLPSGLTLSSTGLISGTPTSDDTFSFTVRVSDASNRTATRAVVLVVTDKPSTPTAPTAKAGLTSAVLTWAAPANNGSPITRYVITPYRDGVVQTAVEVDPAATTRTLNGLTAGSSYTFRVAAVNDIGTSAASAASNSVVPYLALNAPVITSVAAGSSAATVSWTAPSNTGGSPVTGYVVTPYLGAVAQPAQTFTGAATTRTVTGLTPGATYTFKVAATNLSGSEVLYRVNAAGPTLPALDDGPPWAADSAETNPLRTTGSRAVTSPAGVATADGTVPSTTPNAIFDTERYDEMSWAFPVETGADVSVRLYFVNRFSGTSTVGSRAFDVNVDGNSFLSGFDPVDAAGGTERGTMRELAVASDGTVDIDFVSKVENPLVNGIEIIRTGLATTGPQSASSAAVVPNAQPSLTFSAPPSGQVGLAYSHPLVVNGGTAPFAWSVSNGALPAGLTLNASTGLLSGTPTAAGAYSFTVQVTDASGESATRAVNLVIAAPLAVTFTPAAGEVSVAYSQQPTRTGGTAPFSWRISAGGLPAGLTVDSATGLISGTPTAPGTASFTLTVTDGLGATASRTTSIAIAALPTISSGTPAPGQVGLAYSTTFAVAGGTGPFVWSVSAGTVPAGLSFNSSTGVLSGTPTTTGSSAFTVSVTDSFGKVATKAVTLVVNPGPIVITKSADKSSAAPGDQVAYTITVKNTSSTAFTGVNLTDPLSGVLDDAVYGGNASASSGSLTYTNETLSWTGNVAAGATVTITYAVAVNNPAVGNKTLANTVTSSTVGTTCPSGGGGPQCTATVTVSGLSIVHTANVPSTTPGSPVSFTIVVTNTGQTPYVGASFTESLADMVDDATYTGATTTAGSISYSSPTLGWTGNLAVGASATITYSLTVANPGTGNKSLAGRVVSATAGSSCPGDNPATSCTATTTVLVPALSITNTAGVSTTTPGSTVPYTVTLANTGQTDYAATSVSISLVGALDDATYNNNATATAGTVAYDAGAQALVWTGDLAVGGAVTITASLTVRNPDPGNKVLTTVASSSAPGSTCPPGTANPACTSTVQVLVPALTITKSSSVSSTSPGSVVGYTVLVTNTGQTDYTGAGFSDDLVGVLDDASYGNDAAATSGAVSFASPNIVWVGDLAIGASASITYSVTVDNAQTPGRSLTGTVTSTTPGNNCLSGSADTRCTSSVPVLIPGLTIASVADVSTTTPGSVVRLTTTVTNNGQTTYSGAVITLLNAGVLDDAVSNGDRTVTTGTLGPVAGDGSSTWTLSLAPGQTGTLTRTFTVRATTTPGGSLDFRAVSDAPGSSCATGSANASCSVAVPVLIPGLTITKTADAATVVVGEEVVYTISVANTGQTNYMGAAWTDSLAGVLTDANYAGDAVASSGTVSYAAPTLSWSGDLAVGASATITYSVVVLDPTPGDKRMINTVVSATAGSNCTSTSTDNRCTAVVFALVPGLTIAKTADVASSVPGGTIGFTVQVTNSGTTVQSGATFTDSLSDVLDDATYAGGATATAGTLAYAGSTLTWTGDLAVGASATINYAVTVRPGTGGDNLVTNKVTSSTRGSNCTASGNDPRCLVTVPVARLDLHQYASPASVTPGSVVTVTAVYTNTGQVPYTGISVSSPRADTGDDTVPTGDQSASSGTLTRTATELIWTGSIPVGGVVTITRTLTVKNPNPGNQLIRATLSSAAPGNNCPTGTADPRCTFSVPVLTPALSITKTASANAVVPGESLNFTITIANTGQTPYVGASVVDSLVGALDDGSVVGNAVTTTGTLDYASPVLTWTGDLAVGATAVITYSMVATSPATGDKGMVNSVSSAAVGSSCPPASALPGCRVAVLVLTPALTLVKTASVPNATLGTDVTYTVRVSNTGQTPYGAAAFTDSLAAVLDDATYQAGSAAASSGTVGFSGGAISWSGALDPGESATVTYRVTINNPDTGDLILSNTVVSNDAGSNCAVGSTDTRCTAVVEVTNSVTLTLTSTSDVASAVAGQVVQHTVTARNSSTSPVVGASFTDDLTGLLDDADYQGDVSASGGTASFAGSAVSWAGDIGADDTVTVTFSVKVRATATGDQILTDRVSSTSVPGSNNCPDLSSNDPRCVSKVTVASLLLQQINTVSTTTPGSVLRLTSTYTNTGATDYYGITVSSPTADIVDDTVPTGDQSATSGTLVLTPTALVWTGDIPVGATVTVTGTVTVKGPDQLGNKQVTATYVSDAQGNNCPAGGTDPRCTTSSTVLVPGLSITKAADATFTTPGETVDYTVTVRNTGETTYTAATVTDTLTGVLDDASFNGSAVTTSGSLSYTAPTLTWTGDLAVGAVATITYSVTVSLAGTGDSSLVNTVSSSAVGSPCRPGDGSPGCTSSVDVRIPALTTVATASTASAVPGDVVDYSVTSTNTGQIDYPAANLTMALADLLDDATYAAGSATASSGTVVRTGDALEWTGALPQGAQVTITYSVTVLDPVPLSQSPGHHRLEQQVTSTVAGSNCTTASTDPRCTTSVPIASLQILNDVDVASAKSTDKVTYTATFTNTGQVPYVGISITDSFVGAADNAVYNGDATTDSGSLRILVESGEVVWTGDIAVGQTVTVSASVTMNNPNVGDNSLTTQITTNAPASNCPVGSTDVACRTYVLVLNPALSITKVADRATTTPGGTVSYTITATNTGETAYTDAQINDNLASVLAEATYDGGTATTGNLALTDQTLTWTGDLGVGQTVVITYTVTVDNPDLGDKLMINQVTSDELGSTCPTGTTNGACTSTVTVLVPALDITIAANGTTPTPGATVGYTLTITNTGQTDYPGAQVTASLAGVLDNATYTGDANATTGSTSYTEPALTWTGNLAVGATAAVTYSVEVNQGLPQGQQLTTSVSSAAPGSTCTEASPCVNTVAILIPGLAVSTTADRPTATPGDQVTFTIRVENTGQTPYATTTVTTGLADVVDDATFDGTVSASTGVPTYTAPDLSWTGSLAVGQTATITYTVTVRAPNPGNQTLTSTVLSAAAGSTCPAGTTNPTCTAAVTVLTPALDITKTADEPTTTPGDVVRYTILLENTGQTDYDAATVTDSLAEVLAHATYNNDAAITAGGGNLVYQASTLTWTGDLLVGASARITYSVTVDQEQSGDKLLINRVVSTAPGSTCPADSTSAACLVEVRVLIPALAMTKTADRSTVVAGESVNYTVTLTNTGETPYEPATFTDPLADVLDDATYSNNAVASSGTVGFVNDTISWTGPLAQGAVATITYSVTTDFPIRGDQTLINQVLSQSAGATCPDGSTATECRSVVTVLEPALSITKTADTTAIVAGGTVNYTIEAINTGAADYPAAMVSDDLTDVLDDAVYRADASATTGALTYAAGALSWSGGLAIGQSVTITYSVTVGLDSAPGASLVNAVSSTTVGSTCPGGPACVSTVGIDARVITVSDLSPDFTLTGLPGSTVEREGAVGMTVTTNSSGGYSVSVQASDDVLVPAKVGNPDRIPIGALQVRDGDNAPLGPWQSLSENPFVFHTTDGPTGPGGDAISNDYRVAIPDVASDTYSTTLEYIVTAQ